MYIQNIQLFTKDMTPVTTDEQGLMNDPTQLRELAHEVIILLTSLLEMAHGRGILPTGVYEESLHDTAVMHYHICPRARKELERDTDAALPVVRTKTPQTPLTFDDWAKVLLASTENPEQLPEHLKQLGQ